MNSVFININYITIDVIIIFTWDINFYIKGSSKFAIIPVITTDVVKNDIYIGYISIIAYYYTNLTFIIFYIIELVMAAVFNSYLRVL